MTTTQTPNTTTQPTPIQDTLRSLAQQETLVGHTADVLRSAVRKFETAGQQTLGLCDRITRATEDVVHHIQQGHNMVSFVGGYADDLANVLKARENATEKIVELCWLLDIDPTALFAELAIG